MSTGNVIRDVHRESLGHKLERARLLARERRLERLVATFGEELEEIRERLRRLDERA